MLALKRRGRRGRGLNQDRICNEVILELCVKDVKMSDETD